jgi:hypothetical protein
MSCQQYGYEEKIMDGKERKILHNNAFAQERNRFSKILHA